MSTVEDQSELEEAEALVARGKFDEAAARLAECAERVAAGGRPEELGRAAWLAALCSLAVGDSEDFLAMADVAAQALELHAGGELGTAMQSLTRRVGAMRHLAAEQDVNLAVQRIFADHVELLRSIANKGDQDRWVLADADRETWPYLFAAIRGATGGPCEAELTISQSSTPNGVGAVVLATVIGLLGDSIGADELATLCFRDPHAAESARLTITKLVDSGALLADQGAVRLA